MNPEDQTRSSNKTQDRELSDLKHLLRQAMPPLPADQLEPRSDLWQQLRTRIESQFAADRVADVNRPFINIPARVPWFDWALAALAAAALLVFPGIIPGLLYHF